MYVRDGQRGGMGRLARKNSLSGLGRQARQNALRQRLTLMQYLPPEVTGDLTYGGSVSPAQGAAIAYGSPGWTPTQEAQVLTSAINAAGAVGVRAVSPTPTLTYNPATGQYTATGGAVLPAGLSFSSLFSNPLALLAIAGIVAVMVLKK